MLKNELASETINIQFELEEELRRLQTKYGLATEYDVVWKNKNVTAELAFGKKAVLKGEVDNVEHTLLIYCDNLSEARETITHEFFEVIVDELVQPYIEAYNALAKTMIITYGQRALEKALMAVIYDRKESIITAFVRAETS